MTEIVLLDGGMGQELTHRAPEKPTPLWGTEVMLNHPGLVQQVHADYFAAGATVATTNTYAIHHDRLADTPHAVKFAELHRRAMSEAEAARAAHGSGRIAGSIGPLIASYRPDIHPAADKAIPLYAEVARAIAPGSDLIICETVSSLDHARSVLAGAAEGGLPLWMAITVDDRDGTKLRSGEDVADVLPIAEAGGATALLVNCAAPEAIDRTIEILAKGSLPFGAYANGFKKITSAFLEDKPTVDSLSSRNLSPEIYAEYAMSWIAAGATIVGGCCEVGPAHIAKLADAIRDAGHTIV